MINDEKKRLLFEKIKYRPIPKAEGVHNTDKQVILIIAPSRSSKSSVCVAEALNVFLQKKKNIWVVAPSYDLTERFIFGASQVKGVLNYCLEFFPFLIPNKNYQRKKDHILENALFSTIKGKSVRYPDSFVAEPVDLIILEDAVFFPPDFYEKYIRPRILDTKGRIIINSVPSLKTSSWLNTIAKKEDIFFGNWSLKDNIYLDKTEIENFERDCTSYLRRAYIEGLLPVSDTSVFGDINKSAYGNFTPYIEGHYYQAGLDIGMVHDRTVLSISDLTDWRLAFVDIFPERFFETKSVETRLINSLRKYNFPNTNVDISGIGEKFSDMLSKYSFFNPISMYNQKVRTSLIDGLALAFHRGFTIPYIKDLIDELTSIDIVLKPGYRKYISNIRDDTVISLALSIMGWTDKVIKEKNTEEDDTKIQEIVSEERDTEENRDNIFDEPINIF